MRENKNCGSDYGSAIVDNLEGSVEVRLTPCLSENEKETIDSVLESGVPDWVSAPMWVMGQSIDDYLEETRETRAETGNRAFLRIDIDESPSFIAEVCRAYTNGEIDREGDDFPYGAAEPEYYIVAHLSSGTGFYRWELTASHTVH